MSSIREIYSVVNHVHTHGIEGYHIDSKYYDPLKMKKEKQLESSKDRIQTSRPANISKKTSFIDEVQKKEAKMPGPCSYQPKQLVGKSKTESLVPVAKRKTIFDQMAHFQKKQNFPPAGKYDKVEVDTDRAKLHSNISKAENSNYLDSSMRYSLENPGAGNYNVFHQNGNKKVPKWISSDKKATGSKGVKFPPVGTYSPLPVQYQLFENELGTKKRHKSYFNKQERFKKNKDKTIPFYNVLSEWGVKERGVKKDILARISSPTSNRSVYH